MILLLQCIVTFLAVFFKGIQQQNVIGGRYISAAVISWVMAVFDVAVVSLIVVSGWISILPIGLGASAGIVFSMFIYRRYYNNKVV